jgi:hypothetical protein
MSPDRKAESDRGWSELGRDAEAAKSRGEGPLSKARQRLALRRQRLVEQFTGGDLGMKESLKKLYRDQAHWPVSFKKPFSDAVDVFLRPAGKGLKQASRKLGLPNAPRQIARARHFHVLKQRRLPTS